MTAQREDIEVMNAICAAIAICKSQAHIEPQSASLIAQSEESMSALRQGLSRNYQLGNSSGTQRTLLSNAEYLVLEAARIMELQLPMREDGTLAVAAKNVGLP